MARPRPETVKLAWFTATMRIRLPATTDCERIAQDIIDRIDGVPPTHGLTMDDCMTPEVVKAGDE